MEVFVGGTASCTAALQGTATREARVLMHTLPSLVLDFTQNSYAQEGQTLELDFVNDQYGYGDSPAPLWSLPPTVCVANSSATGTGHLWFDTEGEPASAVGLVASADTFCERYTSGHVSAAGSGTGTCERTITHAAAITAAATVSAWVKRVAKSAGNASAQLTGSATCHRLAVVAKAEPPSLVLNFASSTFKVDDTTTNPWAFTLAPAVGSASAQASCEKTTEAFSFDATTNPATLDLDFTSGTYSLIDRSWLAATAEVRAEPFVDNISAGHCTAIATCVGSAQVSFAGQGECVPSLDFAPVTGIRTVRMRRQVARGTAIPAATGFIYVLAAGHVEARAYVYGTWREVARGVAVCTATATGTAGSRIRQAKGNTLADPNEASLVLDFTRNQYDMTTELLTSTGALVQGKATIEAKGQGYVFGTSLGIGSARHYVAATGLNHVDAAGECVATSTAVNTLIHTRVVAVARCTAKLTSDPEMTYAGRGKASCKGTVTGYAEKVLKAEGTGTVAAIAQSTANAKKDASGTGAVLAQVIPLASAKRDAGAKGVVSGTAQVIALKNGIGIKARTQATASCTAKLHRVANVTARSVATALKLTGKPACTLVAKGSASGPFAAKASGTGTAALVIPITAQGTVTNSTTATGFATCELNGKGTTTGAAGCVGDTVRVEKIPASGSVAGIAQVTGINNVNIDLVAPSERVTVIPGSTRTVELEYEQRWLNVA